MGQYVKSKRYMIRPSKKKEVIEFIEDNFKGSKYQTALSRVVDDKIMTWKRWMYYFDYNYLEEILMEEDSVELELEEDLGI